MITTWNAMSNAFARVKGGIPFVPANTRELTVLNDIGHASRVELLVQEQVDGNSVTRVLAAHNFAHDGNSPTSVPSSPENETQGDLTSPRWIGKEVAVVSECKTFPVDSPVQIYKTITGELLRVIFEGTLLASLYEKCQINMLIIVFLIYTQVSKTYWCIVLKRKHAISYRFVL